MARSSHPLGYSTIFTTCLALIPLTIAEPQLDSRSGVPSESCFADIKPIFAFRYFAVATMPISVVITESVMKMVGCCITSSILTEQRT